MAQWYCFEKDENGRPSIPYTLWIERDGTVALCNDLEEGCWHDHTGHENTHLSVGIVGDLTQREPTEAQYWSMVDIAKWAIASTDMRIERYDIKGHNDWTVTQCPGWQTGWKDKFFAMLDDEPLPEVETLLGFHDENSDKGTAGQWMKAQEIQESFIVWPIYLGTEARRLDFAAEEEAGYKVLCNLRFSFAKDNGGEGTLPLPQTPKWFLFVEAVVNTITMADGVWGWTISNEANNPREFPAEGDLTPAMVAETYNEIYNRLITKGIVTQLAPGALDPFNAQAGDPRDWLYEIYSQIHDADFVTAHGYIRGPIPELVGSEAKFQDAPLQWQYLNYPGCCTELLRYLPDDYKDHEVYITEFNHLWKTVEGDWGWVDDDRATQIIHDAYEVAELAGFSGLALYRWAGDDWQVKDNQSVKETVKEICNG